MDQQADQEFWAGVAIWKKVLLMVGMLSVMVICCVYPVVIWLTDCIKGM